MRSLVQKIPKCFVQMFGQQIIHDQTQRFSFAKIVPFTHITFKSNIGEKTV